jgi:hypothetical protein
MSCVVDKAASAREAGVVLPAGYTGDPMREFQETKSRKGRKR